MPAFERVGIIGKQDPRATQTLVQLCRHLRQARCTLWLDAALAGAVEAPAAEFVARAELASRCDLLIVVGGDGTLLAGARAVAPQNVPILGINQGRLGFMVDVNPADMIESLDQVLAGHGVRENRLLLSATVERAGTVLGPYLAVNDVVIRNQASIRMLEFETWLDGEFISQHRADGMIVSSPTGSTAYALSGGGPVLHPGLEAFSLVPICPHTLSDRPIVVGADRNVKIVLGGGEGVRAMFTCDGQTNESLEPGDAVQVSRAPYRLQLIHPANYNYFSILRNKLHWGRAPA